MNKENLSKKIVEKIKEKLTLNEENTNNLITQLKKGRKATLKSILTEIETQ